jgi:CheY-like chemotaxis protein
MKAMNNKESKPILESLAREAKEALYHVLGSLDSVGDGKLSAAQTEHADRCRATVNGVIRDLEDVLILAGDPLADAECILFSAPERLRTIVEVLDPIARQRHLSLEMEDIPEVPWVEADAAAFEHIVTRMIEYAIRSVESGAISLSLRCSEPDEEGLSSLCVALRSPELTMPENRMALHLAKAFASRIGASIQLVLAGAHTRIEILVPVRMVNTNAPPLSDSGIRVLVAEDSDASFNLLSTFLQDQPCSVTRAHNGEQAVAMATSGRHDIVFMDINMPRLDGYAATQRIRDWETTHCRKRMPIIVLSSEALESQMREGAIVGCSGYLEKPVPRTILVRTFKSYAGALTY